MVIKFSLNGLYDDLYNYYNVEGKSAKKIQDAPKKYDKVEAGAKKYAVSRYFKYQMFDDRSVETRSHELQKIVHEIVFEDMDMDEQFQVALLINKLPHSWKEFKKAQT